MKKKMKVILLQKINKLGEKYEVKEVAVGFARNFLLPQNLAVIFDRDKEKFYENLKNKELSERPLKKDDEQLAKIEQIVLNFQEKTTARGNLFAQITRKKIIEKIFSDYKIRLDEDDLMIKEPLKKIGEYFLGLKPNFTKKIKIIIKRYEEP